MKTYRSLQGLKKSILLPVFIVTVLYGTPYSVFTALPIAQARERATITSPFTYDFHVDGTLDETGAERDSTSSYWWVHAGARFLLQNGTGRTIQGDLPTTNVWRKAYAVTNPLGTDTGYHPQNLFQMFLRSDWTNVDQNLYVKINRDNLSNPVNSKAYNGIHLMTRYQNEQNFYLAGVRVDGGVVIKKKVNGIYYTLGYTKAFDGTYNALTNPNLLPKNTWVGIRSELTDEANGAVRIKLYLDANKSGAWKLVLDILDNGQQGATIQGQGLTGIRSDFMDIEFDDYHLVGATQGDGGSSGDEGGYGLDTNRSIEETGSSGDSADTAWWVNSGGYFNVDTNIGRTVQGSLPSSDKWRQAYASANPYDTDNGYHPQNIFRLVTETNWQNVEQKGYFKIAKDNLSESTNREGHNGLLFFNRYQNGQNLYYTGLRVDGNAVIKKKLNSTYYTLVLNKVFAGEYNRTTNPNLLPHNTWIGLKSVVTNNSNGSVSIKLYMDNGNTGTWTLVAEAVDSGQNGAPITAAAAAGVRTDFMDVELTRYSLKAL